MVTDLERVRDKEFLEPIFPFEEKIMGKKIFHFLSQKHDESPVWYFGFLLKTNFT